MANQYVNQVGLADGTILLDVSSDTAARTDVLSGKYFHLATGERTTGTCTYDSNTTDANALATEILSGKTAYVNKVKLTGEMTNNGAVSGTISNKNTPYTVPAGYHSGLGTVSIDSTSSAALIAGNIGDEYGLTRERVRQIIEKAMRKLGSLEPYGDVLNRCSELENENLMLKATLKRQEAELALSVLLTLTHRRNHGEQSIRK